MQVESHTPAPQRQQPFGLDVPLAASLCTRARRACDQVLRHAFDTDFAGFDPYDGLAATSLFARPLKGSRLGRLILLQTVRRSRLNLRPLLGISPLVNPKTLALLMCACADLHSATADDRYERMYNVMADRVLALASPGWSGLCWGYPFDWQARAFYLPAGTPTVVCTSFVAASLLRGYVSFGNRVLLDRARSACDFILRDLNRSHSDTGFAFSYSPLDRSVIHNASALGASLLTDVGRLAEEPRLIDEAESPYRHLLSFQDARGAWTYGLAPFHDWIDGFHTGYLLEALATRLHATDDEDIRSAMETGLAFYRDSLHSSDFLPRSRVGSKRLGFDSHTIAETIAICSRFSHVPDFRSRLVRTVLFALQNLQMRDQLFADEYSGSRARRRVHEGFLRWSNAWIARGLATSVSVLAKLRSPDIDSEVCEGDSR